MPGGKQTFCMKQLLNCKSIDRYVMTDLRNRKGTFFPLLSLAFLPMVLPVCAVGQGVQNRSPEAGAQIFSSDTSEWVEKETIIRNDFERCEPAQSILIDSSRDGYWNLREKSWSDDSHNRMLNSVGSAPDLRYDANLMGWYDVYVGSRAVEGQSDFGVVFMPTGDTVIIRPPLGTRDKNWDIELPVRKHVRMDGVSIVLMNLQKKSYIRHLKFVRIEEKENGAIILKHFTLLSEKGKHFAFPGICRAKNGDIIVVAREAHFHVAKGDYGKIVSIRSRDNGKTWDAKEIILSKEGIDHRDPSIICSKQGTLILSFNAVGEHAGPATLRSRDNGKTWDHPVLTNGVFSPNGVREYDRTIYYLGYHTLNGISYADIVSSTDEGETWNDYSTVAMSRPEAVPMTWEFYDEPALEIFSPGRWLAMFRVDLDGFFHQSVSKKQGQFRTWSLPVSNGIFGTPPYMLTLKNGRVLCSYGYRRAPLGIRACLSPDSGKSWNLQREAILRSDAATADLGYAKTIELRADTLMSVYYMVKPTEQTPSIEATLWKSTY